MTEDKDFMTITNKDIWNKLLALEEKLTDVHSEVRYTNGKVTRVSEKSLGLWISNHPIRFASMCVFAISLLQPEAREAVWQFAKSLI